MLRLGDKLCQRTVVIVGFYKVGVEGTHYVSKCVSLVCFEDVIGILAQFVACYPCVVVHCTEGSNLSPSRFFAAVACLVVQLLQYGNVQARCTCRFLTFFGDDEFDEIFDENSPDVDLIQLENEILMKEGYGIFIEEINENYVLLV